MNKIFIKKLQEIQNKLIIPKDQGTFDVELYYSLIDRLIHLVVKYFGSNSDYIKRLKQLKNNIFLGVKERDLYKLRGLIDIVIDDIELSEKKAIEITKPIEDEIKLEKFNERIKTLNNNIFIVHGHNEGMKQSVARIIEKLGLKPIILHEQSNQGKTIIEKFVTHSNVGFAIVLLSADDIGYSKKQGEKAAKKRARQNVIFELGFFIGKLGRNRVIALVEDINNFEIPSDINGVIYISYDDKEKWKFDVLKELINNGYELDANKII